MLKKEKIKEWFLTYKPFLKPMIIIFIIYLLGISAILRANFNYIDDMGRAFAGYRGWSNFSRYLSSGLSIFLHGDTYLTDISPLPQLLAIFLLTISIIIIHFSIKKYEKFTLTEYIVAILFGLNPYFLECLSYKFDAPYMALSVFFSIFPIMFYNKKNILFGFVCLISALGICTTYQVSAGIWPMFLIYYTLQRWLDKEKRKDIVIKLITGLFGYILGLFIFQKYFMVSVNTYVSTEMASFMNLFPTIFKNYQEYFKLIVSDFKKEWLWLIIIIAFCTLYEWIKNSKQKKCISFIVSCVALGVMLFLSFGIYPILLQPLFSPRAMYGFGIFLSFLSLTIAYSQKNYLGNISVVILSWLFLVFSFTYGNALYVQKTYTDYRIKETIDDLKTLNLLNEQPIYVQVTGSIGYAPSLRNIPAYYQMLNRLIPITFQNSSNSWGIYGFHNYYNLKNIVLTNENLTDQNLPILLDNVFETIYGKENIILIHLKE